MYVQHVIHATIPNRFCINLRKLLEAIFHSIQTSDRDIKSRTQHISFIFYWLFTVIIIEQKLTIHQSVQSASPIELLVVLPPFSSSSISIQTLDSDHWPLYRFIIYEIFVSVLFQLFSIFFFFGSQQATKQCWSFIMIFSFLSIF